MSSLTYQNADEQTSRKIRRVVDLCILPITGSHFNDDDEFKNALQDEIANAIVGEIRKVERF